MRFLGLSECLETYPHDPHLPTRCRIHTYRLALILDAATQSGLNFDGRVTAGGDAFFDPRNEFPDGSGDHRGAPEMATANGDVRASPGRIRTLDGGRHRCGIQGQQTELD
jgi:hypothetical protein